MVEKIWYCQRCQYVPQNIPYDEQPRTCPKCGSPCTQGDVVKAEDLKAIMEDTKRESNRFGTVRSFKSDEKDMKGREARIKEIIEGMTNRKYEIIESKEKLIVRFKKTDEEKDNKLREELEKELLKFNPRVLYINFF